LRGFYRDIIFGYLHIDTRILNPKELVKEGIGRGAYWIGLGLRPSKQKGIILPKREGRFKPLFWEETSSLKKFGGRD